MYDLGKIQAVYKISKESSIMGLFFILFLYAIPILIIAAWNNGDIEKYSSFLLLLLIVGIPCVLFGSFILWRTRQFLKIQVSIYENGIVVTDIKGYHIANWNEIESIEETIFRYIVNGIPTKLYYHYKITKTNSETFRIGNVIKKTQEIGERLKVEANKHNIPVFNKTETR